jgi:hypothetical protein
VKSLVVVFVANWNTRSFLIRNLQNHSGFGTLRVIEKGKAKSRKREWKPVQMRTARYGMGLRPQAGRARAEFLRTHMVREDMEC